MSLSNACVLIEYENEKWTRERERGETREREEERGEKERKGRGKSGTISRLIGEQKKKEIMNWLIWKKDEEDFVVFYFSKQLAKPLLFFSYFRKTKEK